MPDRKAKNLLLSIDVVEQAEEYCRHYGTTLSRLVEDFLKRLPQGTWSEYAPAESPIVKRLSGADYPAREDQYRDYGYEDLIRERNKQLALEAEEMEPRDWSR